MVTMFRVHEAFWLVSLGLWLAGCAASPDPPASRHADEARRAVQIVQERERELAALRADTAAIRIAGAKQDAEMSELRLLVAKLRQENRESHEALFEAQRTVEERQSELAGLTAERDRLLQAESEREQTHERSRLAGLEETVASLTKELTQLKQTVLQPTMSTAAPPMQSSRRPRAHAAYTKPLLAERISAYSEGEEREEQVIHAMHFMRDDRMRQTEPSIIVRRGDSLWAIAKRYRTTVETLRALNGIKGETLTTGRTMILPQSSVSPE